VVKCVSIRFVSVLRRSDTLFFTIFIDKINSMAKTAIRGATIINKHPPTTLPPTTTEQEDIVVKGQRRINLVWELTQAIIAISITGAIIYSAIHKINNEVLTNAFFLIVSMYFVRTNHTMIGGIGRKYMGR